MLVADFESNVPLHCVTPACARRARGARRTVHGLRVCAWCADTFYDALTKIPDRWRDIKLLGVVPRVGPRGRRAPDAVPTVPMNLAWVTLHDPRTS